MSDRSKLDAGSHPTNHESEITHVSDLSEVFDSEMARRMALWPNVSAVYERLARGRASTAEQLQAAIGVPRSDIAEGLFWAVNWRLLDPWGNDAFIAGHFPWAAEPKDGGPPEPSELVYQLGFRPLPSAWRDVMLTGRRQAIVAPRAVSRYRSSSSLSEAEWNEAVAGAVAAGLLSDNGHGEHLTDLGYAAMEVDRY